MANNFGAISGGSSGSGGGGLPVGSIIMWSGAEDAIPVGWALCNGENGTPDLRGKFVLGASDSYSVGATGGEATHILTTPEIPAHSHNLSLLYTYVQSGSSSAVYTYNGGNRHEETTKNAGGGVAHNNMPPYYALCYIMYLGGGGGFGEGLPTDKITLLWQNPSPYADFGAKTISLDLPNYEYIVVSPMAAISEEYRVVSSPVLGKVGDICMFYGLSEFSYSGTIKAAYRKFTIATNGISFEIGMTSTSSGQQSSTYTLIPYRIYGIK